ncbi:COX15/CtaA family protein [Sphingomonas sp. CFBP 13720]|uniref:COX15/CtaA family protein n=1 Tax=Sphingomonas sp. CFBP 13720 TaxID=2775302 RepID=UPI0017827E21|nr:COX15/CtaA family protein [Sphingomonas sp. CFBP 13720]MBD8678809.1 COX15/CtaA family protein [Sphingomonas sp. CFBP 13720]
MLAPPPSPLARPGAVARWLWFVAVLVVAMVVVGGITRLTESGLSITEWKPLSGTIPPLTAAAWEAEFANYRRIPEYQLLNQGMTLTQFKAIFFWEYVHRLLGRIIGLAFALPLLWFWVRRAVPTGYKGRLLALLALGGLQGAVGWWMVASGLSDRTDVSHIRLSVHLLNAMLILAGIVWTALDLRELAANRAARPARLTRIGAVAGLVLFVQLLFGAWVAGLNAGLVTDEWPLMNGRFFPAAEWAARRPLDAIVNDPWVVHFIHRWWAWVAVAALVILARAAKRAGHPKVARAIHIAFGVQILLGISTVVTGMRIEVAALHQLVGALLVVATTWGAHAAGRRNRVS